MLSFVVLSAFTLIWIFILGVIVGRGYQPELLIAHLSKLLPGFDVKEQQSNASVSEHKVLQAEDLDFIDDLRNKSQSPIQEAGPPEDQKERATTLEPDLQKETETAQFPEYQCIYQVAAFRHAQQAAQVVTEFKKIGLQAWVHEKIQSEQKWFRVYVSFTGTEQAIEQFEGKLEQQGSGNFFLRSKKLE